MGLDITYYRKAIIPTDDQLAILAASEKPHDIADEIGVQHLWLNQNFPGREEGLPRGEWVTAECVGGFRAGSYGGYNRWREKLASLVGFTMKSHDEPTPGPFMELIWFADNEGVIGPVVSAKLARDFAEWQDKVDTSDFGQDDDGWFALRYTDWRKAFEAAADGGFVDFH